MSLITSHGTDFTEDDLKLLEEARVAEESAQSAELAAAQAEAEGKTAPAPADQTTAPPAPAPAAAAPAAAAPAPSTAAPAPAPVADAPASAAPAAAAPAPAPASQGDVRAALRASRHAEQQAREQARLLAEENAQLKKLVQPAAPPKLDEEVVADLKSYAPKAAEHIDRLERENAALRTRATAPAAAPAPAAFRPDVFDAETQSAIDDVPELLAMQINPDQTAWKLAKRVDAVLSDLPQWQGKTEAERYVAVVAEVKRLTGNAASAPPAAPTPPAPPQLTAAEIAAAAAQQTPVTLGDMRGGQSPTTESPDFGRMLDDGMTPEQLINSLA